MVTGDGEERAVTWVLAGVLTAQVASEELEAILVQVGDLTGWAA